jgi:hypothetical protein
MTDNNVKGTSLSVEQIDKEITKMNRDLEGIASLSSSLRTNVAEELAEADDVDRIVELVQFLQQLILLEIRTGAIDP